MIILFGLSFLLFVLKLYQLVQSFENLTLKHFLLFELCARETCEKFVYKHSETTEHAKD